MDSNETEKKTRVSERDCVLLKMGDFVYRISTAKEWEELQTSGSTFGGDLDKSSAFFHLSKLDQVYFMFL